MIPIGYRESGQLKNAAGEDRHVVWVSVHKSGCYRGRQTRTPCRARCDHSIACRQPTSGTRRRTHYMHKMAVIAAAALTLTSIALAGPARAETPDNLADAAECPKPDGDPGTSWFCPDPDMT